MQGNALDPLPVGLMQTWTSVETGYWFARSPEFLQPGTIETFRWFFRVAEPARAGSPP